MSIELNQEEIQNPKELSEEELDEYGNIKGLIDYDYDDYDDLGDYKKTKKKSKKKSKQKKITSKIKRKK